MTGSHDEHQPLTYAGARRIVFLVLLLVLGWTILTSLRSVFLLFAIVFLLAMVLNPLVNWLQKRRVPRILSVALVLLALIAVVVTVILFAVPPLAAQVQELIHNWPSTWQGIRTRMDSLAKSYPAVRDALPQTDELAGQIGTAVGTVGNILLRSTLGFVGGVLSVALALLLLIFVLINPQPLVAGYLAVAPERYREQAQRTLARMMRQMHAWSRGVAINGCITGLSIGVGLWLIGMPLALMFGAFAFVGEFLPNIGAFLVSIPILFLALSLGATKFWLALVVIIVVYQIELNLLVPVVLGREMRLHPVNILFFTLAMGSLFGILGAILAVPAAALLQILIDEFYLRPRKLNYAEIDREAAGLLHGKK
jgi:putative permease